MRPRENGELPVQLRDEGEKTRGTSTKVKWREKTNERNSEVERRNEEEGIWFGCKSN